MNLHLEPYQLIMLLLTLAGSIFGAGKAFFSRVEHSIRERDLHLAQSLEKVGEKLDEESKAIRELDREILKLKAELPREYVSKDDFIRSFTVVEAKIDAVQNTLTHLNNKEKP